MIEQLSKFNEFLEKIIKIKGHRFISKEMLFENYEDIKWLKMNELKLQEILKISTNNSLNEKVIIEILTKSYKQIGDMTQCISDIQDRLIIFIKKYREWLEANQIDIDKLFDQEDELK